MSFKNLQNTSQNETVERPIHLLIHVYSGLVNSPTTSALAHCRTENASKRLTSKKDQLTQPTELIKIKYKLATNSNKVGKLVGRSLRLFSVIGTTDGVNNGNIPRRLTFLAS